MSKPEIFQSCSSWTIFPQSHIRHLWVIIHSMHLPHMSTYPCCWTTWVCTSGTLRPELCVFWDLWMSSLLRPPRPSSDRRTWHEGLRYQAVAATLVVDHCVCLNKTYKAQDSITYMYLNSFICIYQFLCKCMNCMACEIHTENWIYCTPTSMKRPMVWLNCRSRLTPRHRSLPLTYICTLIQTGKLR